MSRRRVGERLYSPQTEYLKVASALGVTPEHCRDVTAMSEDDLLAGAKRMNGLARAEKRNGLAEARQRERLMGDVTDESVLHERRR